MKASSKRILSILFSAVFLLGTLVVYGNLIQPEITSAGSLQSLVASKSNLLNGQKTAVAQVSTLIGQFQNASQLQNTVALALPVGPDTTQILNQWQAIAQSAGVTLQALNVQPAPVPVKGSAASSTLVKAIGNVTISVSALGTYSAVKQFLEEMETNVRVTSVQTFEINAASGSGGASAGVYSLQANVSAFYQNN